MEGQSSQSRWLPKLRWKMFSGPAAPTEACYNLPSSPNPGSAGQKELSDSANFVYFYSVKNPGIGAHLRNQISKRNKNTRASRKQREMDPAHPSR